MIKRKVHFCPISEALKGNKKAKILTLSDKTSSSTWSSRPDKMNRGRSCKRPCYYAFATHSKDSSQWEGFHRPSGVGTTLKSIRLMTPSVPSSYATSI
jgi:hypothetical protein